MDVPKKLKNFATNYKYSKYLAFLLLVLDGLISFFIIFKVPYTEIDWETYMVQVGKFLDGENNYSKLNGPTGPLVYPAGHVKIFSLLYKITNHGEDIKTGQFIFLIIYMLTQLCTFTVYIYAKAPPYIFPLLILSKRIHSIFLLRMFNDCLNVLVTIISIFLLQNKLWLSSTILYSLSISIKMNSLLYLPAFLLVLYLGSGRNKLLLFQSIFILAQIQILIAFPFIKSYPREYFHQAFEFSRQFLYKWTVNWRFISESIFLSKTFSTSLLVLHVSTILLFTQKIWLKPFNTNLFQLISDFFSKHKLRTYSKSISVLKVDPPYILSTMATCNLIGILFARSLHYQFYSWFAWSFPYLLYKAEFNPVIIYLFWFLQDRAWLVFPSTPESSALIISTIVLTLAGLFESLSRSKEEKRGKYSSFCLLLIGGYLAIRSA